MMDIDDIIYIAKRMERLKEQADKLGEYLIREKLDERDILVIFSMFIINVLDKDDLHKYTEKLRRIKEERND